MTVHMLFEGGISQLWVAIVIINIVNYNARFLNKSLMKTIIYSGILLVLNLKVLHTSPAGSLSVMGAIAALPNAHM